VIRLLHNSVMQPPSRVSCGIASSYRRRPCKHPSISGAQSGPRQRATAFHHSKIAEMLQCGQQTCSEPPLHGSKTIHTSTSSGVSALPNPLPPSELPTEGRALSCMVGFCTSMGLSPSPRSSSCWLQCQSSLHPGQSGGNLHA